MSNRRLLSADGFQANPIYYKQQGGLRARGNERSMASIYSVFLVLPTALGLWEASVAAEGAGWCRNEARVELVGSIMGNSITELHLSSLATSLRRQSARNRRRLA